MLQKRKLEGCWCRVPNRFYNQVWDILRRTPKGIRIKNQILPQQPTINNMTHSELQFALFVEDILNHIEKPEYRQLTVEVSDSRRFGEFKFRGTRNYFVPTVSPCDRKSESAVRKKSHRRYLRRCPINTSMTWHKSKWISICTSPSNGKTKRKKTEIRLKWKSRARCNIEFFFFTHSNLLPGSVREGCWVGLRVSVFMGGRSSKVLYLVGRARGKSSRYFVK